MPDVGWIDSQDSARLRALQRKRNVEICQPLKLSISEQFPHFWGDQDADANFNGSRIALVTPTSGRIGVSTILSRPAAVSPQVGKDDGSRLGFPHNWGKGLLKIQRYYLSYIGQKATQIYASSPLVCVGMIFNFWKCILRTSEFQKSVKQTSEFLSISNRTQFCVE